MSTLLAGGLICGSETEEPEFTTSLDAALGPLMLGIELILGRTLTDRLSLKYQQQHVH